MIATVYYQRPTASTLGGWHGFGKSEQLWPLGQHETNVGTLNINRVSYSDKTMSFQDSGPPKGPLAEAMGV